MVGFRSRDNFLVISATHCLCYMQCLGIETNIRIHKPFSCLCDWADGSLYWDFPTTCSSVFKLGSAFALLTTDSSATGEVNCLFDSAKFHTFHMWSTRASFCIANSRDLWGCCIVAWSVSYQSVKIPSNRTQFKHSFLEEMLSVIDEKGYHWCCAFCKSVRCPRDVNYNVWNI